MRLLAHFANPKLEAQVHEIYKHFSRIRYDTTEPTDTPPDGTTRIVNLSGSIYLYARAGGAWKRVELT